MSTTPNRQELARELILGAAQRNHLVSRALLHLAAECRRTAASRSLAGPVHIASRESWRADELAGRALVRLIDTGGLAAELAGTEGSLAAVAEAIARAAEDRSRS